ncbi:MAG: ATP-binding cassette domain-containing protein [Planctomycetes bacterium]|nr:ATP-binding cassette domain-containing protein [Planctomycetota bacterium]HON45002.1 ATP-binding cassette domain-containing protein [Planctomycetota bacterium]HPY74680.1 ATP-binding cassette domain-containing protein [Planctomycetota bacterium]HQB00287.1 ATP-binding cassette domain-containing protein [Planctomycetota bacterium]HRU51871.1 ATP-binding cassette domain-containing protein [Planctomycetota bacterium]
MIRAQNLSMYYGAVPALRDVNFEVKKGEIVGLLGPNGAGKSTTLKIITTYTYPTEGNVFIENLNVRENPIEIRKKIGYLPEQLPLYMDMEVVEYLRFVGKARGIHGTQLKERLEWVQEKCGLQTVYRKLNRELSKGYRQRTALAQALIHDPEIVILDEPTSGLDPHQIIEIRKLIKELADCKTVIFSTHILQEVQAVTNRVLIINRGQIVADGTTQDLENKFDTKQYQLILPTNTDENAVLAKIKENKSIHQANVSNKTDKETVCFIQSDSKHDIRPFVVELLQANQWKFLELKTKPYSLEEIFLKLTEPEKI